MLAVIRKWIAQALNVAAVVTLRLWQLAPFPLEGGRCASPNTGSVESAIRGSQILHNTHLPISPQFLHIEDAVFDAFQMSRLLVILLHSELSTESRQSLQRVLQCSQMTSRLGREFSFFAMSVLDEKTHVLPTAVTSAHLPVVAVFSPIGGEHGLVHVATMEGVFSVNELNSFLTDCNCLHGIQLRSGK
jgi:hypothetical protein